MYWARLIKNLIGHGSWIVVALFFSFLVASCVVHVVKDANEPKEVEYDRCINVIRDTIKTYNNRVDNKKLEVDVDKVIFNLKKEGYIDPDDFMHVTIEELSEYGVPKVLAETLELKLRRCTRIWCCD